MASARCKGLRGPRWAGGLGAAALALFLAATGCRIAAQEGSPARFTWAPTPEQVAAWLEPPGDLPFQPPAVSLKVALTEPGQVRAEVAAEGWTPVPWSGPELPDEPLLEPGACGVWRDIPYQELVLHPLKRSDQPGEALILQWLAVEVGSPGRGEALPGPPRPPGPGEGLFVNPQQARRFAPPPAAPALQPAAPAAADATPRLRIPVSQDGLYRLSYDYLDAAGFQPGTWNPQYLHMRARGVELPILVTDLDHDGAFDREDSVLFYGQKLSIKSLDVWNGGDFTDTNVYWLSLEGAPRDPMVQVDAAPRNGYPQVTSFTRLLHAETDSFFDVIDHFRPNRDLWYWGPLVYSGSPGSYSLPLEGALAGQSVTVTALVAGLTTGAHSVTATLNGFVHPTPGTWTGKGLSTLSWTFATALQSGANTLTLTAPTGGDYVIPDYFEVAYPRDFSAAEGALLFTGPNANATYVSSKYADAPEIWDLSRSDGATGLRLPRRLVGAEYDGSVTFEMATDAGVAGREVLICSSPLVPAAGQTVTVRNLSDPALGADLLIVTHPDFVPATAPSAWHSYLQARQNELVVGIQEVYDNYSYGIFDPTALRRFMDAVGAHWAVKPRYVLLIGDSSWDYKNCYADPTYKNWVPSMMFEDVSDASYMGRYASDGWFADWDGDGYPNAAVGRLAVRSQAQSEGVLQKTLNYGSQALSGTWYKKALYIADKWIEPWEQCFETFNDYLHDTYTPLPPWTRQKIYFGKPPYNGTDTSLCAADIRAAFPGTAEVPGSALVNFEGHSGTNEWGRVSLFASPSDVDLLGTVGPASFPLPFVLNGTCYTAAFVQLNGPVLAEDLVGRSDRGAIASSGFTSIGYPSEEEPFATAFFSEAFGAAKVRTVGDLVEAGRFALPSSNARATLGIVLLGDPTVTLRMPAPPPAAGLSAEGGDGAATLAWTNPVPLPASYRVYRSSDGGATWVQVRTCPVSPPSMVDGGLTNGQTYAYYLVSVDAEGFDGPPSNSASATPLNPNAPAAPAGLAVTDPGTGTSLAVSWTPNAEPDLAGYTLYWGTSSGLYTSSQGYSAATTSTLVSGLALGTTYYFALKASNTSGKTSGFSQEAWGAPSGQQFAVRPPEMIADLRVTRSGNDLVLHWTCPSANVSGGPTQVTQFRVYRAQGAEGFNWNPQAGGRTPIQVIPHVSGQTSYGCTDANAVLLADPVTYLVLAVDTDGNLSPASNPPPSPVLDLRVSKSPDGKTLVSFSPVTTNIQGGMDFLITHYMLYGFYPMTAASQHVRPPSPVLSVSLPPHLPACEGGAVYCYTASDAPLLYTVVAVDNRGNTSLY